MSVFKLIEDNGLTLHGDIEHFAELIRKEEREACGMSREAMKQALEALESNPISHAGLVSRKQAITILRQELETKQEPVGLQYRAPAYNDPPCMAAHYDSDGILLFTRFIFKDGTWRDD